MKDGAGTTVNGSHALVTPLLLPSPLYVALKLKLPAAACETDAEEGTLFAAPTVTVETTVPVPAVHKLFGNSVYGTVPVTPVDGKPPVRIAWSETLLPTGTLVELTTVARPGVDFVTVKAKAVAVEAA